MEIKINYTVVSDEWGDNQFEDEKPRDFIITSQMIKDLMRQYGGLKKDEVIHEIRIF